MTTLSQKSFSGGELTPSLYARTDTVKYQTGLRQCRNFLVMRHGGAANRPGLEFVGEVKDSAKAVRLIKFVFNNDQTYVLEFGDQYMRVIQDGAYIVEASKAFTAFRGFGGPFGEERFLCTGHGYSVGDELYVSDIPMYEADELNGSILVVSTVLTNSFNPSYKDGTSLAGFSAWEGEDISSGNLSRVYKLTTTYLEADLAELQFVQSADVLTIVHPSYPPREVARISNTNWTITDVTFAPSISAPTGLAVSGVAGTTAEWKITAVKSETYEESIPSSSVGANSVPTTGAPRTLTWSTVSGAVEYNIYRSQNGVYGYIGTASGLTFVDTGFTIDVADTPPITRNPFSGAGNYPSTVTYIQQRLGFANTTNDPEKAWLSRTGFFKNFTISSPIQDDDAVTFSMAGRQVNAVKHLVDIGQLVTFTTAGEWSVNGDSAGIIKPAEVNPKQHSYNGSSSLPPIVISGNALYVQSRGSIVRDLGFDYTIDGYRGNDLTIFSAHMFDGFELVDWDYQQIPHSVIWAARSDGTLLGLTYVREQQVLAWHRHDIGDGVVENVCVVPEGNEDYLYLVVNRTINGRETRYIERMATRFVSDVVDSIFVDSCRTYDGRNTNTARTMTISGGTNWTYDETLTLTCNQSFFKSGDVGNEIHLTGSDGTIIRFEVGAYTSATVVTGTPNKTVPVAMRSTATSTWSRAIKTLRGFHHIEGESVSVLADGYVVANPNNPAYTELTVTNGAVEFDNAYSVIHVGLPYTSDIETLDIDSPEGESIIGSKKKVTEVFMHVEKSRGIWAGASDPGDDSLDGLTELKIRNDEGYDDPIALQTGVVDVIIRAEWNSNGRVFVRQTDPLPLSILSVSPDGQFPLK